MSVRQVTAPLGPTIVGTHVYFGDTTSEGSWRMYVSGNNLVVERRESGVWVEKSAFLAS